MCCFLLPEGDTKGGHPPFESAYPMQIYQKARCLAVVVLPSGSAVAPTGHASCQLCVCLIGHHGGDFLRTDCMHVLSPEVTKGIHKVAFPPKCRGPVSWLNQLECSSTCIILRTHLTLPTRKAEDLVRCLCKKDQWQLQAQPVACHIPTAQRNGLQTSSPESVLYLHCRTHPKGFP